ncbi:hypothetical protein C0033_09015 [Clostridium sp. chh4-2]|nr:hypothetical protein C0033_09015 [Clostridium sp. chh4-2]
MISVKGSHIKAMHLKRRKQVQPVVHTLYQREVVKMKDSVITVGQLDVERVFKTLAAIIGDRTNTEIRLLSVSKKKNTREETA